MYYNFKLVLVEGTRQFRGGTVIVTLLFLAFINNLPDAVQMQYEYLMDYAGNLYITHELHVLDKWPIVLCSWDSKFKGETIHRDTIKARYIVHDTMNRIEGQYYDMYRSLLSLLGLPI